MKTWQNLLNTPVTVGAKTIPNRVVLQPMEGCDCNADGSPSELTIAKYAGSKVLGYGLFLRQSTSSGRYSRIA